MKASSMDSLNGKVVRLDKIKTVDDGQKSTGRLARLEGLLTDIRQINKDLHEANRATSNSDALVRLDDINCETAEEVEHEVEMVINDTVGQELDDRDVEDEEFWSDVVDDGDDGTDYDDDLLDDKLDDNDGPEITEDRGRPLHIGPDGKPFFELGECFDDRREFLAALADYAIIVGKKLNFKKNEPSRVRVVCAEECPFVIYVSKDGSNQGLVVKTLQLEHNCSRTFKNPLATAKWVAAYFKKKVQERPNYKVKDMKKDVEDTFKLHISLDKCRRAKSMIMHEMEGCFVDEFNKLEAYAHELRKTNPGSDISVEINKDEFEHDGRRVFSRMYVCFNASKVGWKVGCRPLIGVDGTFLKGKVRGILLAAVGIDADEAIYPISFAICSKENTHTWKWFFEWLKRSLELDNGQNITIMSDMQKGLIAAVSSVVPDAEHRFCARHIYANWGKRWRGISMKKRFFSCAWSTFVEQFQQNLKRLGEPYKEAAETVLTYPPQCWVRAYFSNRCLSWRVDNNISESFNAWIDEYRYFPIIRMVDGIRVKMMSKWADSETHVRRWRGNFSPKCVEFFETNKLLSSSCSVIFNGDEGYEISEGDDRHTVFIDKKQCTCRIWDLTGIPCQHAITALYHAEVDPVSQISRFYHKDTYLASYRTKLQPVGGQAFWKVKNFRPMEPPPLCKPIGRPPTKRVRVNENSRREKKANAQQTQRSQADSNVDLPTPLPQKLSKRGCLPKCSICQQEGHNRQTCKERPIADESNEDRGRKRQRNGRVSTQDVTSAQQSQAGNGQVEQPQTRRKALGGRAFYKSRGIVGYGVYHEEQSGRIVVDPGQSSESVLQEGTAMEYMAHTEDPEIRFPIPNESQMRMKNVTSTSSSGVTRKVMYRGAGSEVSTPTDLPFSPPGLMWRGKAAMTTSQLIAHRDAMVAARKSSADHINQ